MNFYIVLYQMASQKHASSYHLSQDVVIAQVTIFHFENNVLKNKIQKKELINIYQKRIEKDITEKLAKLLGHSEKIIKEKLQFASYRTRGSLIELRYTYENDSTAIILDILSAVFKGIS